MLAPGAGNEHPDGNFKVDEWLKALLRCREEQPRRYARAVSPGLQVRVERYAAQKRAHTERKAA